MNEKEEYEQFTNQFIESFKNAISENSAIEAIKKSTEPKSIWADGKEIKIPVDK